MSGKKIKKIPVDALLAEPKHASGSPALDKKNKKYQWSRKAANTRATKRAYVSVGTVRHVLDKKTNIWKPTQEPAKLTRALHTATNKVWYPPTGPNATKKQNLKNKHNKNSREVRFLGSVPLQMFLEAFPGAFTDPEDSDVNPAETMLNINLAAMPTDLLRALRLYQVFPSSISDADALAFIDSFSYYPDVLEKETEDGEVNEAFDEKRYEEFKKEEKESETQHKPATTDPVISANEVDMFTTMATEISDPYTKHSNIEVLDVNGAVVCMLGSTPVKNITNVVADKLDSQTPEGLAKMFSKKGTRNLDVNNLTPLKTGGVNFKNRPENEEAANTKTGTRRNFKLGFKFLDKEGNIHSVRSTYIWSGNKQSIKTLIEEMKVAVRFDTESGEPTRIFEFDEREAGVQLAAFESAISQIPKKGEAKKDHTRTVKERNLFATKKSKKSESSASEEASEEQ